MCIAFEFFSVLIAAPTHLQSQLQVYIGGAVNEADHMVATGQAKVDDFKFMLHLCGWAPGQLQSEIDRGVWLPVASSANVSQRRFDCVLVCSWVK